MLEKYRQTVSLIIGSCIESVKLTGKLYAVRSQAEANQRARCSSQRRISMALSILLPTIRVVPILRISDEIIEELKLDYIVINNKNGIL